MHAAVVVRGVHVVLHVRGLGILAEPRIVVCGTRRLEAPQRLAADALRPQTGADQPVGLARGLLVRVLLHERAVHVAHVLVQGAALVLVVETRLVLGHAVRELVTDHVERLGEAAEDLAVPVAEHHLPPVPERVAERAPVVDGGVERQAAAVDRVAAVHLEEVVVGGTERVVRLVHGDVVRGRFPFSAHPLPRQPEPVLGVVHGAQPALAVRRGQRRYAPHVQSVGAELCGELEALARATRQTWPCRVRQVRHVGEDVRRHDQLRRPGKILLVRDSAQWAPP